MLLFIFPFISLMNSGYPETGLTEKEDDQKELTRKTVFFIQFAENKQNISHEVLDPHRKSTDAQNALGHKIYFEAQG